MKLLNITIQGFRSFRQKQTIQFPTAPGLYLVRGVNDVDVGLEGNDVGKSTLWDAVYWCLYGVTTRGLKAGNIISWGEEAARVTLRLELGGDQYRITRKQNPNELLIDGVVTTQERLLALLDRTPLEFLHSVLVGQFAEYFMDLGPTDKLSLFSAVLDLDYWVEKAELAKTRSDAVGVVLAELNANKQRCAGRIDAMREHKKTLIAEANEWSRVRCAELEAMQTRYDSLKATQTKKAQRLAEILENTKQLQLEIRASESRLTVVNRDRDIAQDSLTKLYKRDDLVLCPFCSRRLDATWHARLDVERTGVKDTLQLLDTRGKKEAKTLADLHDEFDALDERRREIAARLATIDSELTTLESGLASGGENPFTASLNAVRSDLRGAKAKLAFITSKHDLASIEQARLSFWVRGFKDLRLWVLDASLAELEMCCNNSLIQLGLDRWTMRFSVERENKTGGVTRGFSIAVESPGVAKDTPWKSWGGGVTQRLRLASQIGLANLINSRKRSSPNFEVWDEPTSHLSPRGVRDLLVCLQERSLAENKIVYVVDHRSLEFAFDGFITVKKTLDGSEVAME